MSSADPFNCPLSNEMDLRASLSKKGWSERDINLTLGTALENALKMWDALPEAMGEQTMVEKLVPCPVCHGNGYVRDEDGPADCEHCNNQGEVAPKSNEVRDAQEY